MRLASFAPTQRLFSLIALTAASSALPAPAAVTTFVANALGGTVSVVDAATAAEVARVPVGVAAQDVLSDRRGRRVFVTSAGDSPNALPDVVTVINATTNALTAAFDGGWAPVGMARVPGSSLPVMCLRGGSGVRWGPSAAPSSARIVEAI